MKPELKERSLDELFAEFDEAAQWSVAAQKVRDFRVWYNSLEEKFLKDEDANPRLEVYWRSKATLDEIQKELDNIEHHKMFGKRG